MDHKHEWQFGAVDPARKGKHKSPPRDRATCAPCRLTAVAPTREDKRAAWEVKLQSA